MEIKLFSIDENRLFKNKVARFAGHYLLLLESKDRNNIEEDKSLMFIIHLIGKLSLLYLSVVARLLAFVGYKF